jgi:DNA-binding transcriptional regulator YdaS (Cro superfamily)
MNGLDQAIAKAGGVTLLARKLGLVPSAVTNWRRRGRVPAEWAMQIEQETGVGLKVLRPDLFKARRA